MKPLTITVDMDRTFNLGIDIGAVRSRVSVTAEVEEGETLEQAHAALHTYIKPLWAAQVWHDLMHAARAITIGRYSWIEEYCRQLPGAEGGSS